MGSIGRERLPFFGFGSSYKSLFETHSAKYNSDDEKEKSKFSSIGKS